MLKSKIINSWRIITSNKLILSINIIGLTVGLCATILLSLFVKYELSYDKHFESSERIIRLKTVVDGDNLEVFPLATRTAYTEIPDKVTGIERSAQIFNLGSSRVTVNHNDRGQFETKIVDPEFIDLFSQRVILGDRARPFKDIESFVVTESAAERIFGSDMPIGERIEVGGMSGTVTAVIEDLPETTHFGYDILQPYKRWEKMFAGATGLEFYTYFQIEEEADILSTAKDIESIYTSIVSKRFESAANNFSGEVEFLEDIHLFTDADFDLSDSGDFTIVIAMSIVAVLIFIMSIFNSMNLLAIFGQSRKKELAIKKIIGVEKSAIKRELILESLVINLYALCLGLTLGAYFLPTFNELVGREINLDSFFSTYTLIISVIMLVVTTLLAGLYPTYILSKNSAVSLFKDRESGMSVSKLSTLLVIVQQIITSLLIFGYLQINSQMNYISNQDLGFNADNVVKFGNFSGELGRHFDAIEDRLLDLSSVEDITFHNHSMGGGYSGQSFYLFGSDSLKEMGVNEYRVDTRFAQFYKIPLKWGRYLNREEWGKSSVALINSAAAEKLGITESGERRYVMNNEKVEVVGVLEDFVYEDAHVGIMPLLLSSRHKSAWGVSVKFTDGVTKEKIASVNSILKEFDPNYLPQPSSLKDLFVSKYKQDRKVLKIVSIGGLIVIVISVMGLFAILLFNIGKSIKRLAILKIMGASYIEMIWVLVQKIVIWSAFAIVVASPLCYLLYIKMVSFYTYQAPLNVGFIAIAGVIPVILSLSIASYNIYKIVKQNPVESLKCE